MKVSNKTVQHPNITIVRRTSTDPSSVRWHIAKLDKLRGRTTLRFDERWLILRVFYGLHREAHENTDANPTGGGIRARERTAKLCGKAKKTVSNIVTTWVKATQTERKHDNDELIGILQPAPQGNRSKKPPRIRDSSDTFFRIRDFVQTKRDNRERVTSREVLMMLIADNLCTVKTDATRSNWYGLK